MMKKIIVSIIALIPCFSFAADSQALLPIAGGNVLSEPLQMVIALTAMSFIPLLLIATTCFTRFIIVFSMLRFALGLQQTPPNVVLISLSIFLSLFVMSPTISELDKNAYEPLVAGEISEREFATRASQTLSKYMIAQTREEDLSLIYRLSKTEMPTKFEQVEFFKLVPAYILSELRTAFKIAFVIFLPFLMIDLVVSSVLMSLGMIMVPPTIISLPIKVLLFVVLDGWNLIAETLVTSVTG